MVSIRAEYTTRGIGGAGGEPHPRPLSYGAIAMERGPGVRFPPNIGCV